MIKIQQVVEHSKQTKEISLNISHHLKSRGDVSVEIIEEIDWLSQASIVNQAQFTAAKLYVINYSTILTLFNIMSTYVIGTIQFASAFQGNQLTYTPRI